MEDERRKVCIWQCARIRLAGMLSRAWCSHDFVTYYIALTNLLQIPYQRPAVYELPNRTHGGYGGLHIALRQTADGVRRSGQLARLMTKQAALRGTRLFLSTELTSLSLLIH